MTYVVEKEAEGGLMKLSQNFKGDKVAREPDQEE